ncbi:MAG: hypothetical protein K2K95_04605, partial [Muribaculaceae bacterium]|nr:hypothetical protein [Muribaculaceae bacterium]
RPMGAGNEKQPGGVQQPGMQGGYGQPGGYQQPGMGMGMPGGNAATFQPGAADAGDDLPF